MSKPSPVVPTSATATMIDSIFSELAQGEQRWSNTSLSQRRAMLAEMRRLVGVHAEEWVGAAARIKRLPLDSPLVGEEWLSGPYPLATAIGVLENTLTALEAGKSPVEGLTFGTANGQTTVQVLPLSTLDALLLNGFSAEVWLRPGVDKAATIAHAGLAQHDPHTTHGIGVVLGAGNIMSIAPLDVLYELLAHNRVVALKLNPLTDPLLEVFNKIFAPFISLGAVRILTGGADVGSALVEHAQASHVHMTGSAVTHDAIVWGTGVEATERRAAGTPKLDKPITSELGGVSPTIIVPGKWSRADLVFQAQHVATQRLHNGGYNCIAAQAVVISSEWGQKQEFLAELRRALDSAPARDDYYPGSANRIHQASQSHPQAERHGADGKRLLVTNLSADKPEPLLKTEYFAPVLGVVELDASGEAFAVLAAKTVNEEFAGTLGVNIIAHPDTIKTLGPAFDRLVASLRYGTIAINAWTAVGFLTPTATWGGFPGHTIDEVQSGIGVVHNALLLDDAERTVVRGPFRPAPRSLIHGELTLTPKPPWYVNNKTAAITGERLTAFAADPRWSRVPAILAAALRG